MGKARKPIEAQYRVGPDGVAPPSWTGRHYALLAVVVAGLAQGIASNYGFTAWWSVVIGGCALATHLSNYPLTLGALKGRKMTVTLIAASISGAVIGAFVATSKELASTPKTGQVAGPEPLTEADVDRLLVLGQTDPRGQTRALGELSDSTLQALQQRMPEQVGAELKRRESVRTGRVTERQRALEADIVSMAPDDLYSRREAYSRLTSLAPLNRAYERAYERLDARIKAMEYAAEHPASNIRIVRQSWSIGGFGLAYILNITLKNVGDRGWADFAIVCRNQAASGTEIEPVSGKLLQRLRPGQTRSFNHIVLDRLPPQTARSKCEVVDARPA